MSQEGSSTPELSVVVVRLAGEDYVARSLDALARRRGVDAIEVIVPHDDSLEDPPNWRRRYPHVRFLHLAGDRTYAELRALGVREARGHVVAVTEDHCSPDPEWCATILALHREPYAAVGGSVDKQAPDTALNWAIYLSDFSRYMNPVPEGPAGYLTDCNVAYKRSVLEGVRSLWEQEFHETTVNWALLGEGKVLWLSPRVVVQQQRSLTLGAALRERYEFGRLFASTRVAATSAPKRLYYAVFTLGLPVLLVGRVCMNVLRKRRHFGQLTRSLPLIVLVSGVWAWGELLGYVTGRSAGALTPAGPAPEEQTLGAPTTHS